jgi:hypothetical protein
MASVQPQMTHVFVLNGPGCPNTGGFGPHEDRHAENTQLVPAGAYRVTSDAPIVTYFFNSDDLDRAAASSAATVLFPTHVLGRRYIVANMPQITNFQQPEDGGIARASVAVVATVDGTMVTVTASTNLMEGAGIVPMVAGDMQTLTLNAGDVLQLETLMDGDDMTGTEIDADQPVSVFVGHECALGGPGSGALFCDHTEEALLPLQAWGKDYVAPRLIPNGDADDEPSQWQVVASEDGTTVTATAPAGVTLDPPGPFALDAGDSVMITARGQCTNTASCFSNPSAPPGDFVVSADKPILLMQYTMGEPSQTTAVPTEQYLPEYLFLSPGFFCFEDCF